MTRLGQTRSPDLAEVIQAAISNAIGEIHTALPARVEKYDPVKQKIDAKPLLKKAVINIDGSEELVSLPVITDVPVMFPRAGGFFVTFPIQKGDFVLLVFVERSTDIFLAGPGSDTDPVDLRTHDLSDAVAFPCLYPFGKSIKDIDSKNFVMGQDRGGSKIVIKDGGTVEVTFDSGNTLTLAGKESGASLTLGDGAKHVPIVEALQTLWGSMKSTLDTWGGAAGHVHTSAAPGLPTTPPTVPIVTPAWDPSINSSKVSIPNG